MKNLPKVGLPVILLAFVLIIFISKASINIGYGKKAIKIDYAEICKKEFYKSVTVLKKSINLKNLLERTVCTRRLDDLSSILPPGEDGITIRMG